MGRTVNAPKASTSYHPASWFMHQLAIPPSSDKKRKTSDEDERSVMMNVGPVHAL